MTSAPIMINLIHNLDFTFHCDYVFKDRYNSEQDYFSREGTWYAGRVLESNFVADVRNLKLLEWKERGVGGPRLAFSHRRTRCAATSPSSP